MASIYLCRHVFVCSFLCFCNKKCSLFLSKISYFVVQLTLNAKVIGSESSFPKYTLNQMRPSNGTITRYPFPNLR